MKNAILTLSVLTLFVLAQACDLSPEALMGGKHNRNGSVNEVLPVYSQDMCSDGSGRDLTPVLPRKTVYDDYNSPHADCGNMGSLISSVGLELKNEYLVLLLNPLFPSDAVKRYPKVTTLEYRHAITNKILRFECNPSPTDTSAVRCVPHSEVPFEYRDKAKFGSRLETPVKAGSKLAQNAEGLGVYVPYHLTIENGLCPNTGSPSQIAEYTEYNSEKFCDKNTTERMIDGVKFPSLDWVDPSKGSPSDPIEPAQPVNPVSP